MKKVVAALLIALSLGLATHTVETARPPRNTTATQVTQVAERIE